MTKPLTPTSTTRPTIAYAGTRTIKLAPLACPYCRHGLRAQDIESLGNDECRLICAGCHAEMLLIERR